MTRYQYNKIITVTHSLGMVSQKTSMLTEWATITYIIPVGLIALHL